MKKISWRTLFAHLLFAVVGGVVVFCSTATAQEGAENEFMLEEITVTAEFTEKNLQEIPIAITAVTGETLEERAIKSVTDLGLIIPNSAIREQANAWGPNAYIGIRGVDQSDFIPAFEPGVVVYVDDVFNETVVGSTMDLVDLERVEVLRGPQGTLFGKNAIGGAIRLISKTPRGDNTGHLQVTYGELSRLDFSGSYDFSLIKDKPTSSETFTGGGRMTDESKSFAFDHTQLFQIEDPLEYGGTHWDWKLSADYAFTDDFMTYFTVATGFRSEGAQPRPYTKAQLLPTPDEKILMYEIGTKTQFFDNRLRVNAAAFYNIYDPRVSVTFGYQCTDPLGDDPGAPNYTGTCPPDSWVAQNNMTPQYWNVYFSAPGVSKGVELDILARPIRNLDFNASIGWYNYETDVDSDELGYIHPDYDLQADWNYSAGLQYKIDFSDGSVLIPRIDMFYQGERTTGAVDRKPIPGNVIPDYTLYNGRLTYSSAGGHWSISLEAQNLFDEFYWINYPALKAYDGNTNDVVDAYGVSYGLQGTPGRPRTVALTLRYNFF